MSDKKTQYHLDLKDRGAQSDFEQIAESNFHNFDSMKNTLVAKRESTCSIEDMAKELGCAEDEVIEFEQYYSDPTISEVQEYALALMCVVKIRTEDFKPDRSSMYRSMQVPVNADEILEYKYNDEKSTVQIQKGNVIV